MLAREKQGTSSTSKGSQAIGESQKDAVNNGRTESKEASKRVDKPD